MAEILLSEMLPVSECSVSSDGGHLRLSGYGYARTPEAYAVPLMIEAIAKTDSTNLRLHFAKGHIIFQLGGCARADGVLRTGLRPCVSRERTRGRVHEDTWVKITWVLGENQMQVLVDDELRYTNAGETGDDFHPVNYRGLFGPVGIGPAWGSTVTSPVVNRAGTGIVRTRGPGHGAPLWRRRDYDGRDTHWNCRAGPSRPELDPIVAGDPRLPDHRDLRLD